jgi:general secretion pathway protein K
MLAPGQISLARARQLIESRPGGGWESQVDFWRQVGLSGLVVPLDVQAQPQMRTRWFTLDVRVDLDQSQVHESALVDARRMPARLSARSWED